MQRNRGLGKYCRRRLRKPEEEGNKNLYSLKSEEDRQARGRINEPDRRARGRINEQDRRARGRINEQDLVVVPH